jgi:hypothetical protein
LPILIAALTAAVPAIAPAATPDDEIAAALPSQREIEAAGSALGRLAELLLDVRIGPLEEAIDPERRADPRRRDETLRDRIRRDDPDFEQRMHGSIAAMTGGMTEMMARLAAMAPALRETMEDIERRVDDIERSSTPRGEE